MASLQVLFCFGQPLQHQTLCLEEHLRSRTRPCWTERLVTIRTAADYLDSDLWQRWQMKFGPAGIFFFAAERCEDKTADTIQQIKSLQKAENGVKMLMIRTAADYLDSDLWQRWQMKFGPAGSFCSQQKEDVKTRWPTVNKRSKHTVTFVLNRHQHEQQQQQWSRSDNKLSFLQSLPDGTRTYRDI